MLPSRESTAKLSRHRALSASDTQKRQVQGAEEAQKLRVAAHEAMATLQHLNSNPLGCKFKQERERERGRERERDSTCYKEIGGLGLFVAAAGEVSARVPLLLSSPGPISHFTFCRWKKTWQLTAPKFCLLQLPLAVWACSDPVYKTAPWSSCPLLGTRVRSRVTSERAVAKGQMDGPGGG
jgi:hypothetical protein